MRSEHSPTQAPDPTARWRPTPGDVAVAGACLLVSLVALVVSDEPGARTQDGVAAALLTLASLPLLWRRRWPVGVAAIVVVLTFAYLVSGYPGGPSSLPSLIALYTLAAGGHRSWAMAVVLLLAGCGVVYRALVENDPPVAIVISAALYVLVLLLGDAVHSRLLLRSEVQGRLRAAREQRETEVNRRIAEERLRISRDVHDVVAHTLASVGVQAAVAEDLIDDDPARARAALTSVRAACRDATGELQAVLGPLREEEGRATTAPPTLASLQDLRQRLGGDGLVIDLDLEDDIELLPVEGVQIAAYRIVQEALTNVVRHAAATRATVTIRTHGPLLSVTIEDDGVGPSGEGLDGFGLVGMRERVETVGGTLDAGLSASGGFRVEARLPTDGRRR